LTGELLIEIKGGGVSCDDTKHKAHSTNE
jgi:hypothetical protein